METHDLIVAVQEKRKELDRAVTYLKSRGNSRAEAERNYRIALAQKILSLRSEGIPVTIINDLARGDQQIATLRFERDTADVLYTSALEAINNYKLQIRIIDAQIGREWQNA